MADKNINNLINSSYFLSPGEKELLGNVAKALSPSQLAELQRSLTENASPAVAEPAPAPAKPSTPPAPSPKPQIPSAPTGVNLEDLRKRMSAQTVEFGAKKAPPPVNVPTAKPPSVSPAKPASETKMRPVPVQPNVKPPTPAPTQSRPKVSSRIEGPPAPVTPVSKEGNRGVRDISGIKSSQELARVTFDDLRVGDLKQNLATLMHKIFEIAQTEKTLPYLVIGSLEKSSANQLFLKTAFALMDDTSPNRDSAFSRASSAMQSRYGTALSKEEFEAFTEFKEQVGKLL